MKYQYVSIDTIFSKLIRDVTDEFSEGDVIEWSGEALEAIGAVRQYEEAVAFIEVKNNQCELPKGIHAIIQIARDNNFSTPATSDLCPSTIIKECILPNTTKIDDCVGCETSSNGIVPDYIILDCNGQPLNDYDIAYYRPYFDLKAEYYGWCNSSRYKERYSPVRPSQNTFSSALVVSENNSQSLYQFSKDEYTIIQGKILRFSFNSGSIALAYYRQITDSQSGYPMIPDNYSYKTAIVKYITMKMFEKQCYNGREGACGKADKAANDWQWYCKQAGNHALMPSGIDEHQSLLDQRSHMLPKQNRYFGFFGNLNQSENRIWNRR